MFHFQRMLCFLANFSQLFIFIYMYTHTHTSNLIIKFCLYTWWSLPCSHSNCFPRWGPVCHQRTVQELESAQPLFCPAVSPPQGWRYWPLNLNPVFEVLLTYLPGAKSMCAWISKYCYTLALCHRAASTGLEIGMLVCIFSPTMLANCFCPTKPLTLASSPSARS